MAYRQMFAELNVPFGKSLTVQLGEAVEEIQKKVGSGFAEVRQVIKHDANNYTVIFRLH